MSMWFITYTKLGKVKDILDYEKILLHYKHHNNIQLHDYSFETGKVSGVHLHMIVEFPQTKPYRKLFHFKDFNDKWVPVTDMKRLEKYIHKGEKSDEEKRELVTTLICRNNYLMEDFLDPHYKIE